ncbi:hypothetical protein ACOMHN_027237 [Nucella lapillus]
MTRTGVFAQRYCPYLLLSAMLLVFLSLFRYILLTPLHSLHPQRDAAYSDTGDDPGHGKWDQRSSLGHLGVLASRTPQGWSAVPCDRLRKFRRHSVTTSIGKLTMYVYDSFAQDTLLSVQFLKGSFFERGEMQQFLTLSRDLPLIDVGGNLGLVTLQAALQGRQMVSVEPIPENAARLCRSVLDFGHASLVRVIRNAVSSAEGNVTLAIGDLGANARSQYEMSRARGWGHDATTVHAITLDRLLELPLPFHRAALKIDVESHEGHVLAGAERLFQEVDIPLVWMEWQHVKGRQQYGGLYILRFMATRSFRPYNLMTGQPLPARDYLSWPFTVLWRKSV